MSAFARWLLPIAGLSGALAVAFGAFGAHALRDTLSLARRETFETAVRYHFYHTLALTLTALLCTRQPPLRLAPLAGALLLSGMVVFSGSLYALVLTDRSWLGAVTPIGGILLILGWLCLAWAGWRAVPA